MFYFLTKEIKQEKNDLATATAKKCFCKCIIDTATGFALQGQGVSPIRVTSLSEVR